MTATTHRPARLEMPLPHSTPTTPPSRPVTPHPARRTNWHAQGHAIHAAWEHGRLTDAAAFHAFSALLYRIRTGPDRWAALVVLRTLRHHLTARRHAPKEATRTRRRLETRTREQREHAQHLHDARWRTPAGPAALHLSTGTPPTPQPAPTTGPDIISRPQPGHGTLPDQPTLTPRRRSRHERSLRRAAAHHLARMLYLQHTQGWGSLNLHQRSASAPVGPARILTSGGFHYWTRCPFDGVIVDLDSIITTTDYRAALATLSRTHQDEIRDFYRRSPAKGDVCPNIEHSHYTATVEAFDALLDALFNIGAIRPRHAQHSPARTLA